MQCSLENRTVSLSVGEFAAFALGPVDASGGPQGIWRAQLGQHWHNELRARTEKEFTVGGTLRPDVFFEVAIEGRLIHRGWTFQLGGRIDQLVGDTLREIKSVMRPLPAAEEELRADYPEYFRQLAAYVVMRRLGGAKQTKAELVFVEAGSGLAQTIALTPFDEALVHHQLDALVEFLNLRLRATERRRSLVFHPAFPALRPGQETIQRDLAAAFSEAQTQDPRPKTLLFEAPTGYGKTGCVLEFALGQLKSGRFARLIWLTGKSTGQLQVMHTLQQMTSPDPSLVTSPLSLAATPVAAWQVRNKSEHCVNHTFHCVRDNCNYLKDCAERWPGSGLARFYLDEHQPRDLDTLRAAGRDALICPYEITRASLAFNDVWIGDFNYVFAPDNQGLFFNQPGFDPAETLLVIDEAHNLPSRVAGAYSHRATDTDARLLLAELDHIQAPAMLTLAVEEWARLLASLRPTESLDPALEAEVHDHVAKLAGLVSSQPLDYAALGPQHAETLWQFAALAVFLDDNCLTRLLWVAREGELEFTCVDAAPAIGESLKAFGGALLMSATLQPYPEFAASCGLNTPRPVGQQPSPGLRLPSPSQEGISVSAESDPLLRGVVRSDGVCFLHAPTPWRAGAYDVAVDLRVTTTFRERANYYGVTAETVEALHRAASSQLSSLSSQLKNTATPCVAVFFPSYAYAEAVQRAVENKSSVLRVALQPKLPDLTAQSAWIEENLALSDALFLVLGSSFAEGIDLLGGRITHAMVVGPALPEVNAVQKTRMNALADLGRDASFRRVYQIPGLQKVNQALGRLVRAPGQKAKVLLHCRRFAEPSYAALLASDYQMFTEIPGDAELRDWLVTSG
jgi:DNA excision repair protein ERCC-2